MNNSDNNNGNSLSHAIMGRGIEARKQLSTGRKASSLLAACFISSLLLFGNAHAGFFGSDGGKSGLDLAGGYDVNTVATVSGSATSGPQPSEQGHVLVAVSTGSQTVNLILGPAFFWQEKGIAINAKDELAAKGSLAQGQDGKSYLLVQKLSNKTTGAAVEMRSDSGIPAWSGRMSTQRQGRREGGMRFQGGAMMRGGGGMRR